MPAAGNGGEEMGLFELLLIAVGLSMDAFAVSVCKGLATKQVGALHMLCVGLWFGVFQALMPLIGYFLGLNFQSMIESVDHWIAFLLLAAIGVGMIVESRKMEQEDACYKAKAMFPLAVATSIDALAVGISFAVLDVNIVFSVVSIGICTFFISAFGLKIGSVFGSRFKSKAEVAGGIILILIGLKILLEHLGILRL